MDLGFETCGNATLIAFDRGEPVLATDPWITGTQYFGSWMLPYRFSAAQEWALAAAKYVWLSHGHPDHLNLPSLERLRHAVLLVPQHRGGRILRDLQAAGFQAREVPTGEWVRLSDRIAILTCPDWNQDAAVLVAVGGRCGVLNLNDGGGLGNRPLLARRLQAFARRFVLRLINYGDGDMMNFFNESEERIEPVWVVKKPLGLVYSALLKRWDGTHTAPFSSHHMYAREDSRWASRYETRLEDHGQGFVSARGEFIPGFFSYDALRDRCELTPVERVARVFHDPREFGDDWSECLEAADVVALREYFSRFEHLRRRFEFINVRVGGRDHTIGLGGPKGRGLTFAAPRASLMTAVRFEIFDDLLLGNFVRTILHGGVRSVYPDFAPYVAKYGDNGRAFTEAELRDYFAAYRRAAGLQGWIDRMRAESSRKLRVTLAANRAVYLAARTLYRRLSA